MKSFARLSTWIVPAAVLLASSVALGAVRHEGSWPDADKPISVDASGLSRSEAVRRVAEAAGWSVVVHAPPGDPVDVHVKNQPAGKVLDLVLDDADYVARRDGTLVQIARVDPSAAAGAASTAAAASATPTAPLAPSSTAASAATAATPTPPAAPPPPAGASVVTPPPPPPALAASVANDEPPATSKKGDDRVVTGGKLRVEKGEVVDDVTVMGGSVDVDGTVTGDLVVVGGSARVHPGAVVHGDATAIGGALDVEDGATVDGDVGVVGGVLHRAPGAKIHGSTVGHEGLKVDTNGANISISRGASSKHGDDRSEGWLAHQLHELGGALTRAAMLFVFGCVLLALATQRMDKLRLEIASRPMRSLALGVVGILGGALLIGLVAVTIIGIPVAVVAAILGVFGGYAGMCAVLTTVGAAVSGHRTQNPYVHLAVGCGLFFLLGAIPYVGGIVTLLVTLGGVGVVVATRGAGLVRPKGGPASGPYRNPATV